MALDSKVGSFNIGTAAAGSTETVTGVGFTPEAVIFWWNGTIATGGDIRQADDGHGVGFMVSSTSRGAIAGASEHAAASSNAAYGIVNDAAIISIATTSGTDIGAADFQEFNSDGFAVIIDTAFTQSYHVAYLALGGDITSADVINFGTPTSTGTQDITSLDFQPDFLMFLTADNATLARGANKKIGVGAASGTADADNAFMGGGSRDNRTTMDTGGYTLEGESVCVVSRNGLPVVRGTVRSLLTNGFQVHYAEVEASANQVMCLALAGGSYSVGTTATKTDTSDIATTGLGFTPTSALFFSSATTASNSDIRRDGADFWSVGGFSATDERVVMVSRDRDAGSESTVDLVLHTDAVYASINDSNATDALMDVKSLDADGFTMVMDDADSAAMFVWYAAFGAVAAGGSSATTRDLQDSVTFTDDLARNFWGDRLGADIRDVFTFSDSFAADLILIRELSDTVATLSDSLSRQCELLRRPQDSNVLVDTIVRDLDLIRELQDTSTFSDVLDVLLINIRELQDTVTFSDALARDQDLVRLVQDTLVLVENLDRTNTGDTDTVADHHRFKLWQNLRRWRLYKPRDQIH